MIGLIFEVLVLILSLRKYLISISVHALTNLSFIFKLLGKNTFFVFSLGDNSNVYDLSLIALNITKYILSRLYLLPEYLLTI